MNIKDYLHLYFGCEVKVNDWKYKSKLTEIHADGVIVVDAFRSKVYWGDFKLLLRPLSDMTEEEQAYWDENFPEIPEDVIDAARQTQWLLSKHFDLFNLIENNLAIDKTKIHEILHPYPVNNS